MLLVLMIILIIGVYCLQARVEVAAKAICQYLFISSVLLLIFGEWVKAGEMLVSGVIISAVATFHWEPLNKRLPRRRAKRRHS